MGRLHLGEMTEMAQRLKNLEDTDVVKLIHNLEGSDDTASDVSIVVEGEE